MVVQVLTQGQLEVGILRKRITKQLIQLRVILNILVCQNLYLHLKS